MALELTNEDIVNLVNTVSAAALTSFALEQDGLKIAMEANNPGVAAQVSLDAQSGLAQLLAVHGDAMHTPSKEENRGWQIKASLVGTFYRSPDANTEPYVSEGNAVKKGQVVGIIEAMKIINEIVSDADGIVEKALVENGQIVGYNDPLFIIRV